MSRQRPSQGQSIPQPPHSAGRRFQGLRSALDPSQIPSAIAVCQEDQIKWSQEPYMSCAAEQNPPLASTYFTSIDQGNSTPRHIRLTTYAIPYNSDLASTCQLPLGAVLQPFAAQRPEEEAVPSVEFRNAGPPRCDKCMGYINPWCTWMNGGQRWVCNLCDNEVQVPAEYFSRIESSGRRADHVTRAELNCGTVDFAVPKDYWALQPLPSLVPSYSDPIAMTSTPASQAAPTPRAPEPLKTIFLIDVSETAISSNVLATVCSSILDALYNQEPPSNTSLPTPSRRDLVSIVTFDSTLQFYDLSPGLSQASMHVVADIEDVFVPIRHGLFVEPHASRTVIEGLLTSLPRLFGDVPSRTSALGSALRGGLAALAQTGGHIIAFQSCIPTIGVGALETRLEGQLIGTPKENALYLPQDSSWRDLGEECAEAGVGVSVFMFPDRYIDVASIGIVSSITGGQLYFHPRFDPVRDTHVLQSEIRHIWTRETIYNCSMRVRCSKGLQISSFYGNFHQSGPSNLTFGVLSPETSLSFIFNVDSELSDRRDVYIQSALLYTSASGERRVRTHNLALRVSTMAGNVFRYADVETTVCVLAKEITSDIYTDQLQKAKDSFTEKCAGILLAYRRNCAAATPASQFILPEALKLLPLYALSIVKTKALKGGSVASDVRVFHAHRMLTMSVDATIASLYPRMMAVHDLTDDVGVVDPTAGGFILPTFMRTSYLGMQPHGAYLVDNGDMTVLWIGNEVSPQLLLDLFNVEDTADLGPKIGQLPQLETLLSAQVRNIIGYLESRRGRTISFYVARQNIDASELEFSNMLVEDQNNDAMSYVDYICLLHKQISAALSTNSSLGVSGWKIPW